MPWMPLALLAGVSVLSLIARVWSLKEPCATVCASERDRTLIFDETYYVNAARVIDGLQPSAHYIGAPAGTDPNAEHPQLGKLIIAGSIRLFGDTPLGWRIAAVLFGSAFLIGVYALVRSSGGGPWLALGSAALAAAENLLLVHGRIGTLDIMVVTLMIWSAVLYLRGRRLPAGLLLGIGACLKLVAPYLLLVFLLVEAMREIGRRRSREDSGEHLLIRVRGLALCGVASAVVYIVLLASLDRAVPAYDTVAQVRYDNPIVHTQHMLKFAADLSAPNGAQGIASYPWQWLGDYRPIVYANVDVPRVINGQTVLESTTHFLGVVNPPILAVTVPAFVLALIRIWRRPELIDIVAVAWTAGTFIPFVIASAFWHRISYLYYMVVVMPGILLLAARLFSRPWMPRWVTVVWALGILGAGALMYPFTVVADPNWVT